MFTLASMLTVLLSLGFAMLAGLVALGFTWAVALAGRPMAALAAPVFQFVPPQTLGELLELLKGPAALAVMIWFSSWGLEEIAAWHGMKPKVKSLLILLGSALLGIGSVWLSRQTALIAVLEPYIASVLSIAAVWIGTQIAHRADKSAIRRRVNAFMESEGKDLPQPDPTDETDLSGDPLPF